MPATPIVPPLPTAAARAHREALHREVAQVERLIGPSQVAHLRGAPHTWTEPEFARLWESAARRAPPTAVNNLYVHVPFCKSICAFCNYDRLKPSHPSDLKAWEQRVLTSIERLAPAARGLTVHALYFGGGTPSVLPARVLDRVLTALDDGFAWHRRAGRSIELDPALVNPAKVAVLLDHGFHHFSFGVQTQSATVNAAHNRGAQGPEMVSRCLDLLPGPARATVACDILLGLAGVTPDDTLADLALLLAHPRRPRVDVFHLTPTRSYVDSHFAGSREAARAALARYDDAFDRALADLCRRHRYRMVRGGSHHARTLTPSTGSGLAGPAAARARGQLYMADLRDLAARAARGQPARLRPWRPLAYTQLANGVGAPLNLLGLGPSARSQVFGMASARTLPHAGQPGETTYVGAALTPVDELRSYALFALRDRGRVTDEELHTLLGMTLAEGLPDAVAMWAHEGFIEPEPGGWRWHRGSPEEVARLALWAASEPALRALLEDKR